MVGLGGASERQQRPDHALDLLLVGAAAPADRLLDGLRRVREAGDAGLAGGEQHAPRACPTANAVRAFCPKKRSSIAIASGSCSLDQVAHARVDLSQAALERLVGLACEITPPSSAASVLPRASTTP